MENQNEILALESRQVALLAIMASSDARASKCSKLGLVFEEEYPDDYDAYVAANSEYNINEETLAGLYAERDSEQVTEEE